MRFCILRNHLPKILEKKKVEVPCLSSDTFKSPDFPNPKNNPNFSILSFICHKAPFSPKPLITMGILDVFEGTTPTGVACMLFASAGALLFVR